MPFPGIYVAMRDIRSISHRGYSESNDVKDSKPSKPSKSSKSFIESTPYSKGLSIFCGGYLFSGLRSIRRELQGPKSSLLNLCLGSRAVFTGVMMAVEQGVTRHMQDSGWAQKPSVVAGSFVGALADPLTTKMPRTLKVNGFLFSLGFTRNIFALPAVSGIQFSENRVVDFAIASLLYVIGKMGDITGKTLLESKRILEADFVGKMTTNDLRNGVVDIKGKMSSPILFNVTDSSLEMPKALSDISSKKEIKISKDIPSGFSGKIVGSGSGSMLGDITGKMLGMEFQMIKGGMEERIKGDLSRMEINTFPVKIIDNIPVKLRGVFNVTMEGNISATMRGSIPVMMEGDILRRVTANVSGKMGESVSGKMLIENDVQWRSLLSRSFVNRAAGFLPLVYCFGMATREFSKVTEPMICRQIQEYR